MNLTVIPLAIPDVKIIVPPRYEDSRGFFSETFNAYAFDDAGIDIKFCQDNHSLSRSCFTLRGLHYQAPPFAQTKLIRVVRGRILDVAVDARCASATFGRWVSAEISADAGNQLLVPKGFLHGFLTLEPDTEVLYKVDAVYDRASDGCVRWDDADLAIDWGNLPTEPVLSEKDSSATLWSNFSSPFR